MIYDILNRLPIAAILVIDAAHCTKKVCKTVEHIVARVNDENLQTTIVAVAAAF